jgi:hypothetical protein
MTETEFKKMFERIAEPIMMEIWKPIEENIKKLLDSIINKTTIFEHKIMLTNKRHLKIRREFIKLNEEFIKLNEELRKCIDDYIVCNNHLEEKIHNRVKKDVDLAIEYGKKSEELYLNNKPDFDYLTSKSIASIKNECDLRIMEILNLEKRFRNLIDKDECKKSSIIL